MLEEIDYQITHALQMAPRVPWGILGEALGISAVTVSRRWERLVADGLCWISAYPGPHLVDARCAAFIDVDCAPGARGRIVRHLLEVPQVASLQVVAGPRPLFLTVMINDLESLSRWISDDLGQLSGVRSVQTRVVTRIYAESVQWRIGSLSPDQQRALRDHASPPLRPMQATPRDDEVRLMRALALDGRRSAVELAADVGLSPPTVRRRLDRLLQEGMLSVRCDVAQVLNGWPVTATVLVRVPAAQLDGVAAELTAMPQVRVCCSVTGDANLIVVAWLHRLVDLPPLQAQIERIDPAVRVLASDVTLETVKRLGAVLDRTGQRVGVVPVTL